ncbi:hypothetical protein I3U40_18170 [Mycobacteroides abscessus subsp. abscessus]|uniref:hypothetical protein n=1 Tax=Mycobacteroides abscessus TaxID=36809 RepID=UPI0009A65FDE|nr:hypothetical protein [Mycobacteroides abscessus]QSM92983.1 hypothetical protein I3U31_18160 [Mycobacteroides abscessus subsp. abscessus]QSM98021.1 hypothetical protein I3U40_18170 [Mycobacteroides abscessus subsp. abscessus]
MAANIEVSAAEVLDELNRATDASREYRRLMREAAAKRRAAVLALHRDHGWSYLRLSRSTDLSRSAVQQLCEQAVDDEQRAAQQRAEQDTDIDHSEERKTA